MAKIRLHELAKELNVEAKEIIAFLGEEMKSISVVDEDVQEKVRKKFSAKKAPASEDVSADAVYELTKALFDNNAALKAGHAKFDGLTAAKAIDGSFDLHPGAEKYYKEVGAIK